MHGGNIRESAKLKDEKGNKTKSVSSHNFAKHADWLVEFDVQPRIVSNDHDTDIADLYATTPLTPPRPVLHERL
jgi:hypothetical protein